MVGEIEVTLVNEGHGERPLDGSFVKNAPLEEVQAALADVFQPPETLRIPYTTTVINTGGRLVLIDAGLGEFAPATAGRWMANFTAAGYSPEQVDLVIVSHFHGDHIQGLRDKAGQAMFPNATVTVSEPEWAFWMDEGEMSRAPEGRKAGFETARRVFAPMADAVERFADGAELAPGIRAMAAHGHTPGHTTFMVTSGEESLLVWSDTTNKPELFVRHPTWQAVFDMDGEQAAATRARLLDMAATDRLRVSGYHFPFPATGYIAQGSDGYRYVPAFWHA
jgi:glyoxylase-like metal-dependent hydrolase (beta-lactamase superfamily II)